MLSELAIDNPQAFSELIKVAKDALNGKVVKEVKSNTKEVTDLSSKTVAELKQMAKAKNIEGYTTMKKA